MGTNILMRDLGVRVSDKRGLDVSGDKHIRQVFLRTGLVDRDSVEAVVDAARVLNPEYPGELDLGAWRVGRDHCHDTDPECTVCPLTSACPKRTDLQADGS